jgi:DNA-binding Xre family transcriptional regulator
MNIVVDESIINRLEEKLAEYDAALSKALNRLERLEQERADNELLTTRQACKMLSCSPETLLYYRTKKLNYYKKGREGVWYRKGDIMDWLAKGYVNRQTT